MKTCQCNHGDLPCPGHVRIAVFCADCGLFMEEIRGDIDEQIAALAEVGETIHAVRDAREAVAAARKSAREGAARRRSCCAPPADSDGIVTVTMTEVYGDEGFRPFG